MIFKYLDYRPFIKDWVENNKNIDKNFNYQGLAEKILMQKSYLSRILSGNGFLNQDQAFLISKAMKLNEKEHDFLILLIEYDRTSIAERKNELHSKIKIIQKKQINSEKFLSKKPQDSSLFRYYSNPLLQILHITLLTGEANQRSLNQIKNQLSISDDVLNESIECLKELKIISQKNGIFINESKGLHLKYESPMTRMNHFLLRQYSMNKITNLPKDQTYSFSTTFSSDDTTFLKIKTEFLHFLKNSEVQIDQSNNNNSYQINFDLFPWFLH